MSPLSPLSMFQSDTVVYPDKASRNQRHAAFAFVKEGAPLLGDYHCLHLPLNNGVRICYTWRRCSNIGDINIFVLIYSKSTATTLRFQELGQLSFNHVSWRYLWSKLSTTVRRSALNSIEYLSEKLRVDETPDVIYLWTTLPTTNFSCILLVYAFAISWQSFRICAST